MMTWKNRVGSPNRLCIKVKDRRAKEQSFFKRAREVQEEGESREEQQGCPAHLSPREVHKI